MVMFMPRRLLEIAGRSDPKRCWRVSYLAIGGIPQPSSRTVASLELIRLHENIGRHLPVAHQLPDHRQRQMTLAIKNFGRTTRRPDNLLEILSRASRVFHSRKDR